MRLIQRGSCVSEASAQSPAGPAGRQDWLGRFEPLRAPVGARRTRRILCRDRQGGGEVVVEEVRAATLWIEGERRRAIAGLTHAAEILAALAGGPGAPCFPRLKGAGLDANPPWIALEPVDGPTLRDAFPVGPDGAIRPESGWTLPEVLGALLSLRPGLAGLHALGGAHGSIRPEILAVEGDGPAGAGAERRLRLRDLGRAGTPDDERFMPEREGLPYVHPLILGRRDRPGPEADVWPMAVVLFELLSGRPPFQAGPSRFEHEERFAARRRIVEGPSSGIPSWLPADLSNLLRQALTVPHGALALPAPRAGGDPLGVFFAGLARCLESAKRDPLWSQARLPNPAIGAIDQPVRVQTRLTPALLMRRQGLWETWRSASQTLFTALDSLAGLGKTPPWSGWRDAVIEQEAAILRWQSEADPRNADVGAVTDQIGRTEAWIARLDAVCAEGCRVLGEGLAALSGDLAGGGAGKAAGSAAGDPALRDGVASFSRELSGLAREAATGERLIRSARLLRQGEALRERVAHVARAEQEVVRGRRDAEAAFGEAVRREDWSGARAVLAAWPGGEDAVSHGLLERLDAWRSAVEPAEKLLRQARSPQTLQALAALARRAASPPPGFEEAARRLAGRLLEPAESARAAARSAIDRARSALRAQAKAAERAAERAALEGVPDCENAARFRRTLQALEEETDKAERRLGGAPDDFEHALSLPSGLQDLETGAATARRAWWPRDPLPAALQEWSRYEENVRKLIQSGEGGVRKARRLLQTQVPPGWEEAGRALLAKAPEVVAPSPLKWIAVVSVVVVLAGAAFWILRTGPRPSVVAERDRSATGGTTAQGGREGEETRPTPAIAIARPTPAPTAAPSSPTPPIEAPPTRAMTETWINGPALRDLTLDLQYEGQETRYPLPGMVACPEGARMSIALTWEPGGRVAEQEAVCASGEELRAKVLRLLTASPVDAGLTRARDQAVAEWADAILREGR